MFVNIFCNHIGVSIYVNGEMLYVDTPSEIKQYGIDLDSDGGIIVTPTDIANSPYLEVVQSYGY